MTTVSISTADGTCPAYVFQPVGRGPWPGVLVYMDGVGIRPAMLELGERLATYGFYVLLPDYFYRSGLYEPMDAARIFSDPEQRKILFERFFALATQANVMRDTRSFLDHLHAQADVRRGPVATTGYCLGGTVFSRSWHVSR